MKRSHKYCEHNKVRKSYADGGEVKMKPHVPPRMTSPILDDAGSPGGPHTPGAKGTYPMPGSKKKAKKKAKKTSRRGYADGGKVSKKIRSKKKPKKPEPEMLGTGAAANAGTILRDKRKQQMDDLGL